MFVFIHSNGILFRYQILTGLGGHRHQFSQSCIVPFRFSLSMINTYDTKGVRSKPGILVYFNYRKSQKLVIHIKPP